MSEIILKFNNIEPLANFRKTRDVCAAKFLLGALDEADGETYYKAILILHSNYDLTISNSQISLCIQLIKKLSNTTDEIVSNQKHVSKYFAKYFAICRRVKTPQTPNTVTATKR